MGGRKIEAGNTPQHCGTQRTVSAPGSSGGGNCGGMAQTKTPPPAQVKLVQAW